MNKLEKLTYLKNIDFNVFSQTRHKVKMKLSDRQTLLCCCGQLATGLHEDQCKKFNDKVDAETINRLIHLLLKKSK